MNNHTVSPSSPPPTEDPVSPSSAPEGQSYWREARIHFFKNRLAVLSLLVIFFIATIGVFCPVLANKRPLFIKMVFSDEYDENFYIVLDVISQLEAGGTQRDDAELNSILKESLVLMQESLSTEHVESFQTVRAGLLEMASKKSFDQEASTTLLAEFENTFELSLVKLKTIERYPLFSTLSFAERFFMLGYILFILFLFARRLVPSMIMYVILIAATSGILSGLSLTVTPLIQDELFYRKIIESPIFGDNGERVIRTLIPYGENENITTESRQPPTWMLKAEDVVENQHYHLLGTDTNGRDVLTRMIYGARISMLIGIIAVSIYVAIGIFLGSIAGFYRGWIDMGLSRLIEIVICFPVLFLILSVQAFLQPSIFNIIVALGIVSWTGVARLQRGEFLRLVNQEFVLSARSMGASNMRLIFRHILPNALGPILIITSFGIAGSILVESTLSFLGFGVPQPMASWGDLLNNGRNDIQGTWWLTVFPGFAIFLTVTCFNLIGEGVRDALDPKRDSL